MSRPVLPLELRILLILRVGVGVSIGALAIGLALWMAGSAKAEALLSIGLVLLMTIPIARIVASFVDAVRRRDRLLSWATAAVLLILACTITYSLIVK